VQGTLECLQELGWIRPEALRAPDGGRPTVRFHLNPRLRADGHPECCSARRLPEVREVASATTRPDQTASGVLSVLSVTRTAANGIFR